jgi:predicted phage terminase large subunit-like protein
VAVVSPPARAARPLPSEGAAAAYLARRFPEAYQRYVFGLEPRPHHLAWFGLLGSLLARSSVVGAEARAPAVWPAGFDPEAWREGADAAAGESEPDPVAAPRLYVVAPPGHSKSTIYSQVFPCWYLGHHPQQSLIMLTSSTPMARTYHDVISAVLAESDRHAAAFPDPACRGDFARGWSTDGLYLRGTPRTQKEPALRVAGWSASVLGARAHGIILDDALTQEESESALVTERAWNHLTMTIENRLHPGGWLLGVGTRWTADDLIGRARRAGWPVYRFPALGAYPWGPLPSKGEAPAAVTERSAGESVPTRVVDKPTGMTALWPTRFPVGRLAEERRRIGGARFETVWQGVPTGVGAGIFRSSGWFRPLPPDFPILARRLATVMHIDTAFSEKKTADFTAAVTAGYDPADPVRRLYFTHFWRHKVAEDGLAADLADHIAAVRPGLVTVEVPAFRQEPTAALVAEVGRLLIGRHACAVAAVPVSTDKVVRARAHAAKAEAGDARYDRAHPLWPIVEAELLSFPGGQHDDLVDACSGVVASALVGADLLLRGQGVGRSHPVRFG